MGDLEEIGPSFKMELDRAKEPDRERWKSAIKVPKEIKSKKVKNVAKDYMGKRRARIHLGRQDFDQIHTVHHGESKRKKLKLPPPVDGPGARKSTKKRRAAARGAEIAAETQGPGKKKKKNKSA